ncbi:MAG: trypsin-like peptidase domain-containing protein [Actinomycetota bacterium]|nr:trypsin-like peptidase domain-containing protein [Actinomycetota bacterium]
MPARRTVAAAGMVCAMGDVIRGLLAVLVAAATACSPGTQAPPDATAQVGASPAPGADQTSREAAPRTPGSALPDVSDLVSAVRSGVVAIAQRPAELGQVLGQDVPAGAGTGFAIDDQGHVVTNFHVVRGADQLAITTVAGEELSARLVGQSPSRDLALLEVDDAGTLQPIPLGDSAEVEVGDPVVAIGNALALGDSPTVSLGIVSATGRAIQAEQLRLDDLIQTDAAINPGNSGGPLLNGAGEVVGINVAVAAGGAQNIGFAISIDSAKPVIRNMLEGLGEPYIGVTIVPNSPQVAARLGLATADGLVIADIAPGGPAGQAGLRPGDVIVAADGSTVSAPGDLQRAVQTAGVGASVSLEIVRGTTRLTVDVGVEER